MGRRLLKNQLIFTAVILTAAVFLTSCSPGSYFPFLNRPKETASESVLSSDSSVLPSESSVSSSDVHPGPAAEEKEGQNTGPKEKQGDSGLLFELPEYSGKASVVIHDNVPFFKDEEITSEEFIAYSPLDSLGRCGPAFANISLSTLPGEDRGLIGDIRPSGWQTVKYEGIDGKYLYNRCHLVAYCLAGDNASEQNLITGTRYLNIIGMLPVEMEVLGHVVQSRNHVLYRATPVFVGDELVARGVLIEALSAEDRGAGLSLCVYCFNVQPGIEIDYATGESVQREVIYMPGLEEKNN